MSLGCRGRDGRGRKDIRAVATVNMKPKTMEPTSTPRKSPTEWRKATVSKMCLVYSLLYSRIALEGHKEKGRTNFNQEHNRRTFECYGCCNLQSNPTVLETSAVMRIMTHLVHAVN